MTGHLIHIGYPKTGSSFLRRWFSIHPQLAYAEGGIAGFRDVHQIARHSAAPAPGIRYRVTSSEGLATPHVYVGERAINYDNVRNSSTREAQAEACATLARLFPTAHVLLVTRGFRSAVLSGYSQYVRTGGADDLEKMIGAASQTDHFYLDYDYMLRLYGEAFGQRLLALPYELLRDDPESFIRAIEDFLRLLHVAPPREQVNPSLSPGELRWYPRLTRLVRQLPVGERPRRILFGSYVRGVMNNRFRLLIKVLQRLRPATPVTGALATDDLLNRFRGRADSLRTNPLYAPYAHDYLFTPCPERSASIDRQDGQ